MFLNENFCKQDWYVDLGAIVHLTANEHWVRQPSYKPNTTEIFDANENKVSVICSGNVNIVTIENDLKYDISVEDVCCAPEVETNLLSVNQLIKKGNKVLLAKDCCEK